jgi:Tol biopolymer transport system component
MSPEQAKARPIDRRSDIWAFGCVLYEMLSGKPTFTGETVTDILASVVRGEPEWSQLPSNTPPRIREILHRCLHKDQRQRLQSIGEARITLEKYLADPNATAVSPDSRVAAEAIRAMQSWKRRAVWGALCAFTLAAGLTLGAFSFLHSPHTSPDVRPIRAHIKPVTISSYQYESWSAGFALSPDGRWFTYVAKTPDGKSLLWLRSLDAVHDKPLPGTEKAEFPFWSPDSRFIAFFADAKLKKMEIAGSSASVVCDAPNARGGTWNREGTILFSHALAGPLQRVSATGGTPSPVTVLNLNDNENSHRWPFFLPDGRHFLYQSLKGLSPRDNPTNTIQVASLDSKETKVLVHSDSNAIYASGQLIFLRQNALVAQPFDLHRLELTGEAVPIAEQVAEASRTFGLFSGSQTGLLTYLDGAISSQRQLTWVDRSGRKLGDILGQDFYVDPVLSPDGRRLTFLLGSTVIDVWVYDFFRDIKTRLTFGTAGKESNAFSVWSPDGRSIAYLSYGDGKYFIRRKLLDGSGREELLLESSEVRPVPFSWSPDGKILAYHQLRQGERSIWMLPLTGEHKPYLFLQSAYRPQFSPDGKWLAYCSFETGRLELFVVPFPGPGGKWQVSIEGGCQARWRRDGKELFFLNNDKELMAAAIRTNGSSFEIGALRPLFETHIEDISSYNYDVSPDGQRFICNYAPEKSTTDITLVVNWDAELKKK